MAMRAAALLVLAALVAGAAADACEPRFNWFPTAAEIGEDIVINNKTCSGKQVCNFPNVWHKANQTAYMAKLATDLNRGLLNVALKQYGNQPPRLFFTPVSEFLEAGADVSPCANSRKPATTRHLLARAKVVRPGQWSYTVRYDDSAPVKGVKIAGQSGELDARKLNQDGAHCAEVAITVSDYQVSGAPNMPPEVTTKQKICWFKTSKQASAKFTFDMCTDGLFTVNVSDIHPVGQNLTQNGTAIMASNGQPEMLFRPVIHLFGSKNKTLDGKVLEELEYDDQRNPRNFINRYIVLPKDLLPEDTLSVVLDQDKLDEGYYKLTAKVAMATQFPDLVDGAGQNKIIQADAYGDDVRGFTEFLGVTVVDQTTMVGVQRSKTTLSEITSDKTGQEIKSGDPITFSWHFVGIGEAKCFHDGVELPKCASGMEVVAKDVAGSKAEHTFKVVFTDVCGNKKEADYVYTSAGVVPQTKADFIPVTASSSTVTTPKTAIKNSSSAASPASFLAAAAFALLLALLL